MRFDVITLFPDMVKGPLSESILGKAIASGLIQIRVHNLRDWAEGRHLVADDAPFGGGDGMVMKPEPLARAIRAVKEEAQNPVALLTPQGERFSQGTAARLAKEKGLILVCGHYAGVDERVREKFVDLEISIGDYVVSGGEPAALVVIDAVARLVPGVLGNQASAAEDSFPARLEYPQYTRPAEFEGMSVPEVLLSGNHELIRRWRLEQSLRRTLARRPDLLERFPAEGEEREILDRILSGEEPDP